MPPYAFIYRSLSHFYLQVITRPECGLEGLTMATSDGGHGFRRVRFESVSQVPHFCFVAAKVKELSTVLTKLE